MKKLSILLILILCSYTANAQELTRKIEVYGTSSVMVQPDMLQWNVSAQYESNSLQDIKREIDRATDEVLNVLRRAGVKEEDIQTGGIVVYKNYIDPVNPTGKKFNGSNQINFILRDIKLYPDLTEEFFEIENVFTSSPSLEYSGAIETREKARENALLAARKKAEDMARVMGVSLGRVMTIQEEPDVYSPMYNTMNSYETTNRESGKFSEGQISIEARVKLVIEIQ